MAHRKVVFVIVEGPSDSEALGVILSRLLDNNEVHIEIIYEDITTQRGVNPGNIVSKIGDIVRYYAKTYALKQSDFQEVIHLVDLDGAYVSNDAIIEVPGLDKVEYFTEMIQCRDKEAIIRRNEIKRANIDRIYLQPTVWRSVLYRVYYMSSNLDHVLYNKLNSSDTEKKNDAIDFSRRYKDNLDEFIKFISSSKFSVQLGYKESWEYIKEGNRSLKRYTNLGEWIKTLR